MFGRTDQIQIFPFDFIHHIFHFGKAHNTRNDVAVDHKRGDHVGKALIDHKIARVGQHRRVQTGNIAREIIEALSRRSSCGVNVHAVELFQNIQMIRHFKIGHFRFAETL